MRKGAKGHTMTTIDRDSNNVLRGQGATLLNGDGGVCLRMIDMKWNGDRIGLGIHLGIGLDGSLYAVNRSLEVQGWIGRDCFYSSTW